MQLNFDLALLLSEFHGIRQLVPATKHVILTSQPNSFILLQPCDFDLDLSLSENSCYIKQGSDLWHSVCSKVRVTGSTIGKAIRLDTLSAQKVHHSVFVQKKPPPVPTPDVMVKLQHGSRNEVHALATLVDALIPALLPPCHSFFEVGTLLSDSPNRENFLAVSPDRFIQCTGGGSKCKYNNGYNHHRIAVEVKCPFPNQDIPEEPYYKIPARHVPQVLAEMAVSKVEELWLICLTRKSVTLVAVTFDGQLWKHIFDIAVDLYDPENPKVPTRLHALLPLVKKKIKQFIDDNSTFAMEVPPFTGSYGPLAKSSLGSPYSISPHFRTFEPSTSNVQEKCHILATEAKLIFHKGHRCL